MRSVNRLLAVLLCLAGIALCVVVVGEIALFLLGRAPWLVRPDGLAEIATGTTWSQSVVVGAGVVTAVLGLLLLVVELRRARVNTVELRSTTDHLTVSVTRRSLEQALRQSAVTQPGVAGAAASVRGRRALVTARTDLRDTRALRAGVEQALTQRMDELRLASPLRTKVSVDQRKA